MFPAARVHTMDQGRPTGQAVAVADGRIVSVGSMESMQPWLRRHPHRVDDRYCDKVVLPGFIDPPHPPAAVRHLHGAALHRPHRLGLAHRSAPGPARPRGGPQPAAGPRRGAGRPGRAGTGLGLRSGVPGRSPRPGPAGPDQRHGSPLGDRLRTPHHLLQLTDAGTDRGRRRHGWPRHRPVPRRAAERLVRRDRGHRPGHQAGGGPDLRRGVRSGSRRPDGGGGQGGPG